MRYNTIREMDVTNGIGIGCSVFFQGCSHHCYNCFNQETWSFDGGKEWTEEVENKFIELCKQSHIEFISLLGGEPFDQNNNELYWLLYRLKYEVNKPIFIWSGYTYEYLLTKNNITKECIQKGLFDYLIDGKYIHELRDINLKLRGSSNQRIWKRNNTKWENITETY